MCLIHTTGASDSDNDTLTYSIVTEDSDVHRYFYIDEHTGKIYLRSPLKGLQRQNFTFKVKVEDETYPVKSDEADVIIRVSADRHPPQFTRFCESPTVLEVRFTSLAVSALLVYRNICFRQNHQLFLTLLFSFHRIQIWFLKPLCWIYSLSFRRPVKEKECVKLRL